MAVEHIERAAAKQRQGTRTDLAPPPAEGAATCGKISHKLETPEPKQKDRMRDRIGAFAGVSGRTVENVCEAAPLADCRAPAKVA